MGEGKTLGILFERLFLNVLNQLEIPPTRQNFVVWIKLC